MGKYEVIVRHHPTGDAAKISRSCDLLRKASMSSSSQPLQAYSFVSTYTDCPTYFNDAHFSSPCMHSFRPSRHEFWKNGASIHIKNFTYAMQLKWRVKQSNKQMIHLRNNGERTSRGAHCNTSTTAQHYSLV